MASQFKVSQSKVKTYRRCLQAYDYRYNQKLKKKRKSRPLQFGTMIHSALERHFNGDDAMDYFDELRADVAAMRLFAQEREEYGDILEDCEDIIRDYLGYWEDDDLRPIRKKGRGAEHTFEIELFPDVIWNGKLDLIGVTPNKLRWLVEHKTYTRQPGDDERWRNLQSVSYFRANDILGWKPLDGTLWDYIKSRPPAVPGILKDESLSQKAIDTLPSKIMRILEDRGEKPKLYPQLMASAEKNRGNYFQRIHTPVNRAVADMVFSDFTATVQEMVRTEEKRPNHWPMNIEKHCGWCDYEPLCRARLQGLDVDYIRGKEYLDGTKDKKQQDDDDEKPPVHTKDHAAVRAFAGA